MSEMIMPSDRPIDNQPLLPGIPRSLRVIVVASAEVWGINPALIMAPEQRSRRITEIRHAAYLLADRLTRLEQASIAPRYGTRKDNFSRAVTKAKRRYKKDEVFAMKFDEAEKRALARLQELGP